MHVRRTKISALAAAALCGSGVQTLVPPSAAAGEPTPLAAQHATLSFQDCLGPIEGEAERAGVSNSTIARHLRDATPDLEVLQAVQGQAEFEKPIWEYLDAAVSEARVTTGQAKLVEWGPVLDGIEARFGVDRHMVMAIWGIESSYGAALETPGVLRPVVRSLATLACGDPSRAAFWRDQLIAALQMLDQGVPPSGMTGSWAGAMGHTQFMPTVYQRYAVDGDGDGKVDIWGSVPDALASTANYLHAHGWRLGEEWGYEVELPPAFDYRLADETTTRPLSEWIRFGIRLSRDPTGNTDPSAALALPTGSRGPAFLFFPNFRAILQYNTALPYALSVAHLSDRLRGAPPFVHGWPRGERMLTADERRELQTLLAQRGFDLGTVDGKVGPKTRAAIRTYQAFVGLQPDGFASAALLERVRAAR